MSSLAATAPPMPLWRRTAIASGEYANNITWQSIELFLLFFYTDVLGISPLWAGYIFALGSICDAVSDPIVGALADRTRSRWGRFRPWMVISAPVVAACLVAAFTKPDLAGPSLVAYALATHLLLRSTYMTAALPFLSLTTRAVPDADGRSTLAGTRMQFAALAGLSVSILYPIALTQKGVDAQARAFLLCAAALAMVAWAVYWGCAAAAREPSEPPAVPGPRRGLIAELAHDARAFGRMATRNGSFLRVILAIVVISICLTMVGKMTVYYFKYYLHAPQLARIQLVLGALILFCAAPVWAMIARKISKLRAWNLAALITCGFLAALFLNPSPNPYVSIGLLAGVSLGSSGFAVLFWAMLPDTVEMNDYLFGSRDDAKAFAFALFARKLAIAFNAVLIGWAMTASGFHANVVQSAAALGTLKLLIAGVPFVGAVLSVLILRGYKLDAREHGRIRTVLAERLAAGEPAEAIH